MTPLPPEALLPPELFPIELQPIIYFILLPLALIVSLVIPWILYFFVFPPEARLYIMDKIHKKPLIDYETEDGTRHLETAKIYPEGFLIGDKSKNIYLLPRPTQRRIIERELEGQNYTKKQIDQTYRILNELENRVLKAGVVKGLGVRIFRAYQSVGIASSLAQLVGLTYTGNKEQVYMAVPVVAKTKNVIKPTELYLEHDKKLKEWFVKIQLPVIPSVLQKFFNHNYTQNQLIAVFRKGIQIGEARARNPMGKWLIPIIVICLIVGIVVIVAAVALG